MNRTHLACAVMVLAGFVVALGEQQSTPFTGQWMMDPGVLPDEVQLTLHRSTGKSGHSTNSSSFLMNNLKGLTQAQMDAAAGAVVHFEIVRDAGTLACEGYFKRGNGSGAF